MRRNASNPFVPMDESRIVGGSIARGMGPLRWSPDQPQEADKAVALADALKKLEAVVAGVRPNLIEFPSENLKESERADITKNPRDSTGWRKPSDYSAKWVEKSRVSYTGNKFYFYSPQYSIYSNGPLKYYECNLQGGYGVVNYRATISAPPHRGPSSNTENALLARALSQVKNQKFDLALALLESRESLATLNGLLRKLRAIFIAIRKKDLSTLRREIGLRTKNRNSRGDYTKSSSSLWLEAMYGVRPIIYDVYGLCDLFTSELREVGFRIVARSKRKSTETEKIRPTFTKPYQNRFITGDMTVTHEVDQQVSLWYELDADNLHLAEALGLTNPALWIWEKTTLSFVVDWILPIGDSLSSLTADLGFKYLGGCHTYRARSFLHGYAGTQPINPLNGYEAVVGINPLRPGESRIPLDNVTGRMERSVYKTAPLVGVYFKDPFSVNNIITTVALIGGRPSGQRR